MTLKSGVGSVQFLPDRPLLETELNELQSVQNEAREDIIRDSIPSGFTSLGELDFTYMENNENVVKLKSDSVAFVNGMRIFIPAGTTIDIGKAPEKASREDLLFLEVWKEEVGADGTLTEYGGEKQASIPNHILDQRVGQETAKRVINRWRIRHVANVDFVKYSADGFCDSTNTIGGSNTLNPNVLLQGGASVPFSTTSENLINLFAYRSASKLKAHSGHALFKHPKGIDDCGVYVSGVGIVADFDKNVYKCIDGYSYAIPMFKLYRKPSAGKSIPTEYTKINPKVDYSKFAKLMSEEKVERVISENVKGNTLVNLVDMSKFDGGSNYNSTTNSISLAKDSSNYSVGGRFKANTKYTLMFTVDCVDTFTIHGVDDKVSTNSWVVSGLSKGVHRIVITEPSDKSTTRIRVYGGVGTSQYTLSNLMILEGDWTNKELPKYFTGLKSLSEEVGNLVTVKDNILSDSAYDPNDGNQKLISHPTTTNVNSGNVIIPPIEAKVKRGETELSTLTSLNTKLTTEGNETVEFTNIKGKTLQNLAKPFIRVLDSYAPILTSSFALKPSTVYTLILSNTSDTPYLCYLNEDITSTMLGSVPKGVKKIVFTTLANVTKDIIMKNYPNNSSFTLESPILLEGDHTGTPLDQLPYVEGIKSVGEAENNKVVVKTTGKNLFDVRNISPSLINNIEGDAFRFSGTPSSTYSTVRFENKLKPGTYIIRIYDNGVQMGGNGKLWGYSSSNVMIANVNNNATFTLTEEVTSMSIVMQGLTPGVYVDRLVTVQIEEGSTVTAYEPYKEFIQEVTLKEPLRSLPNGVCDEIVGNKVTRRIGKVTISNTTSGTISTNISADGLRRYFKLILTSISIKGGGQFTDNQLCNSLKIGNPYGDITNCTWLYNNNGVTEFRLSLTGNETASTDYTNFLASNPLTFYYELATPITEDILPVYEKESVKTYQLSEPLRSLPNGVKDEIKNGVLIRRCGEITLNGSESWLLETATTQLPNSLLFDNTNDGLINVIATDWSVNYKHLLSDKIPTGFSREQVTLDDKEGICTVSTKFRVRVPKSKLSTQDLVGFKAWLQANPVKVVYQLATPTETILKEVKPQSADFSLQRHLASGTYLRELPNGVRDTVENGKVIRRVGRVVLNGAEAWTSWKNTGNTFKAKLTVNDIQKEISGFTNSKVLSSLFISQPNGSLYSNDDLEGIGVTSVDDKQLFISILGTKLTTKDLTGFKAWLSANPVTVIYELATPVEEALTTSNNMLTPSHEINSTCGSMYVGQGRNYVTIDSVIPKSEEVIINTDFREVVGNTRVSDCRYKKVADGYNTSYIGSNSKNLLVLSEENMINPTGVKNSGISYYFEKGGVRLTSTSRGAWQVVNFRLRGLKHNTPYILKYTPTQYHLIGERITLYEESTNTAIGWDSKNPKIFTIPSNVDLDQVVFRIHITDSNGNNYAEVILENIQFELGEVASSYIPPIQTTKYKENTEANDVDDLRHKVSLTGFNYDQVLNESFDLLLRGEL